MQNDNQQERKEGIPKPPKGGERLKWLGPSFLWMLSAGSEELLFTPRIAALYGYSLLWALLAAAILKWFINGEVGRFTVCTVARTIAGLKPLCSVGSSLVEEYLIALALSALPAS